LKHRKSPHQSKGIAHCYPIQERSNQLHNFPQPVSIPENLEEGRYVIGAALLSLYGASVNPVLVGYNVTVTIGEETSEDYVNSWDEE